MIYSLDEGAFCGMLWSNIILVILVTFGHPWLRHSSHLERAVVLTDVVRVSKPAVYTLRLSV
jgi:hypothetical protein